MSKADVAVVGLGAMGSAVCYHLARRGMRVVGFDKSDIPNDRGSSGGESRIIRMCYFEHPDYVPLLRRAYELWHALAAESGEPIIEITGGLFMGSPESELVAGSKLAADEHALQHEMLSNAELRRRYPQFNVTDDMIALYEPTGGFIRPELAIAAHARLAVKHGAGIFANEPVTDWRAGRSGAEVRSAGHRVEVKSIVFCSGAWTPKLVHGFGADLWVSRQVMAWVQPRESSTLKLGGIPVWAMEHDEGDFHYGFPSLDGGATIKVARHEPGRAIDPDELGGAAASADEEEVRPFLRRYMPMADGPLRAMKLCMYTNAPEARFIVDVHPSHHNVFVATGFSGHGFKFATVMGEAIADLVETGATALPIGFLKLSPTDGNP